MMRSGMAPYLEISVSDLEEGMILQEDVVNDFGSVLIPANTVVEDPYRAQSLLSQHRIRRVRIKRTPQEDNIQVVSTGHRPVDVPQEQSKPPLKLEKQASPHRAKQQRLVEGLRQELKNTQEKLAKDFERIIKGENLEQEAIKQNIEKTLEVFKSDINVFQLIEKMRDLDDITYAHSQNVTIISYALGKWLELSAEQLQQLTLGAMLMDIGKMQIPPEILNKQEKLTHDELLECQKHAIYSHELIKSYDFINEGVKQIVLFHHERMDGSGYPMGLKGEKIPFLARIVAVADIYNALTSDRPYRKKLSPFEAIKILEIDYKDKLDTKILYVFLNRIGNCFLGQHVKLSNGQTGEIIFLPKQNIYRPLIKLDDNEQVIDLNAPENTFLDIVEFI